MNDTIEMVPSYELTKLPDVKELDKAVRAVNQHIRKAAEYVYKLGGELKRIRDERLWEARLTDKDLPKYPGFWQFCDAEIRISESYIRRLITVNENFPLKDVKKYGISKLTFSMQVPKAKRRKYLEAVTHVPATSPEIKQVAAAMRTDDGQERAHIIPNNTARVDIPLGLKVVPMFRGKPHGDGKADVPAENLSDNPWAETKLSSRVKMGIRFTRNEMGKLIAIVDIRETS